LAVKISGAMEISGMLITRPRNLGACGRPGESDVVASSDRSGVEHATVTLLLFLCSGAVYIESGIDGKISISGIEKPLTSFDFIKYYFTSCYQIVEKTRFGKLDLGT
jgi:hypothetical protein